MSHACTLNWRLCGDCLNESSWGISDCRQETNKHVASVARNDASYEQISITVPLLNSPSSADHSLFFVLFFKIPGSA